MTRGRLILVLALALVLVATGFLREFTFLNINEQIAHIYYETEESHMSAYLSFLKPLSYDQLINLKWGLTAVFSIIFLLESCLVLWVALKRPFWQEMIFSYVLLFVVSFLLYGFFSLTGDTENGYTLARFFMGIAQSPLPVMFLAPALLLRNRTRSSH